MTSPTEHGFAAVVNMMRASQNQKSIVMSRPISITDIIDHITPSHNRISKFIMSTLELEHKLAHPDEQSEYFRWAMRNNGKHYRRSTDDYHRLRQEFNDYTVDALIAEKEEAEFILREKIPSAHPLFARAIMRGACINRIHKYNDYLSVKSITPTLPSWEDLKNDTDLITAILDV